MILTLYLSFINLKFQESLLVTLIFSGSPYHGQILSVENNYFFEIMQIRILF